MGATGWKEALSNMGFGPYFRLTVEDVFIIRNRGTVVTGIVDRGSVKVGDEVHINGASSAGVAVVTEIEIHKRQMPEASEGDMVGLLFRDSTAEQIKRGDILTV
jgi:elongation factor Tu